MKDFLDLMKNTKQHLMTGVSYMIPFVVAGGILLALSVLLYGSAGEPKAGVLRDLFTIGAAGLALMVPILSGFIAYSMVDRPGLAPGIIGGYLAYQIGAGFLGGIISGLVAGILVFYLKKIKVPSVMRSVMPIFVIPLVGTFFVGGLMVWVVGKPVAVLMVIMKAWLTGLGSGNLVVLAVILGLMMAFDMGGPVNKVAYSFGVAMVGTISVTTHMASPISLRIMACIGVADCTPPLGLALASILRPKKYTLEERGAGKAAFLMGLMGITEGAIPFAAADPLRVIPSIMIGSASGSVFAMLLGAKNPAPWGGWIVLPVVTGRLGYIIGTAVGVAVTVLLVNFLKKPIAEKTDLKAGHDEKSDKVKIEIQE